MVLAAGWAEGVEAMVKGARCAVVPSMALTAGSGEGARPMGGGALAQVRIFPLREAAFP